MLEQMSLKQEQMSLKQEQISLKQEEANAEMRRLNASRAVIGDQHCKVSASNTDHGRSILNSLVANRGIVSITSGEGPAVLTAELIQAATLMRDRGENESEIVNLYTPSLMEIIADVNPLLRLVNSETYQWIRCASGHRKSDMKPDLFSAYHPLVRYLSAYSKAPDCSVRRLFGKFEGWQCRSSIHCIWGAKKTINMEGFGEKCKYLQIAGEDCFDHNGVALKLKGILFDVDEFWMIRSSGNTIVDVVKCRWLQEGSRQCLVDFLRNVDPWIDATAAICERLHESVVDFSGSEDGPAWLGSGANGRVFKLESGKVIKVVVGEHSQDVEKEFKTMLHNYKREATSSLVFPVVEGSHRAGIVGGVRYAGYLMAKEGEKMKRPLSDELRGKMAIALFGLHCNDVIHGDPRIENALLLDGEVKWIDFRESDMVTAKVSMRRDVSILFESLGGVVKGSEDCIEVYVNSRTVENLQNVFSLI